MIYVSQIIMLYTLSSYSAIYQLYLNKTGIQKQNEVSSGWRALENRAGRPLIKCDLTTTAQMESELQPLS